MSRLLVQASLLATTLGLAAFWPAFDARFAGAGLQWGGAGFWPAYVSATLVALSNPISFGAFLGDWSRYLPRRTNRWTLMGATVLAQS